MFIVENDGHQQHFEQGVLAVLYDRLDVHAWHADILVKNLESIFKDKTSLSILRASKHHAYDESDQEVESQSRSWVQVVVQLEVVQNR